ncbi:MFS transporter [Litoreibacter roseus]|uniref:MFS transporter n=2 Tax=Litoreibacter roseus TaxID=2601869 RepID=A0A6N6JH53_9RHOB|nr:MFS transporter [Litoreibacter roseus]
MMGTLASAVVMIWAGGLTDRIRVRYLGFATVVCLAMSCGMMTVTSEIWMLPFVVFALRLFGQGMSGHTASVAMARWFTKTRGRALAVASFGFAVGEAILPIVFVALMAWIGWRASWGVSAAILIVLAPLLLVLLKEERNPRTDNTVVHSLGLDGIHWSRLQVLRFPLFWFILPALLGPPAFGTAFFFLQVHLAEIKGWSHLELVSLFPAYTAFAVISMMLSGLAIDRFGTAGLMVVYTAPSAIGFILFAYAETLFAGLIGILFFAITTGIQATLPAAFWAQFFGTRHLGSIKAMATAIMVFGSAIGPGLTGWGLNHGFGFETQMLWISGYLVFGVIMAGIGVSRVKARLPVSAQIDVIRP